MTERRAGPPSGSFADRTAWARNLRTPLREFLRTETGGAVVLLAATVAALVWANADASSYERVWETQVSVRFGGAGLSQDLRQWVNSGLMTVFFFVVGLEARREFDMGELRDRRRFALPLAAGVGGMVVPVAVYLAFNAGGPAAHGWGIAMSTDTAFALGVLALVGRAFPARLRTYLLTATVVDDVIALAVIAVVYSGDIALPPLLLAVGILAVTVLVRALGVRQIPVYVVLGVAAWAAVQSAGVEPVVVGLVMGLLTYAHPAARDDLERATEVFRLFREQPTPEFARSARTGVAAAISPNERLQLLIHPWASYAVVPLFALANAGVTITAGFLGRAFTSAVTLGIVIGYVAGKPVGILGASWLVSRVSRGRLRPPVGWAAVGGGGAIAGIGLPVARLLATLSFTGERLEEAKERIMAQPFRVTAILDELSDPHPPEARIMGNLDKINRYFASDRLEDILDALDEGAAEGDEWAAKEADTIRKKSPMACKVSLKLLQESPYQLHFVDEMRMEFGIMVRLIHHPDFKEGVRALLIDKDGKPNWHPTNPTAIGERDVEAFFEPLPPEEEWRPFDF